MGMGRFGDNPLFKAIDTLPGMYILQVIGNGSSWEEESCALSAFPYLSKRDYL